MEPYGGFPDGWDSNRTKIAEEALDRQYSYSAANYKFRWEVYKFAVPPVDIHWEAAIGAKLEGHERVLDVGCGDGSFLIDNLYERLGHQGSMVGADKHAEQLYIANFHLRERGIDSIQFFEMNANNLEFEDNSFDTAFALFSLYHTDPTKSLGELKRVVKPGGKVVIATSGLFNKQKHRKFEHTIARWISEKFEDNSDLEPSLRNQVAALRNFHLVSPPHRMNARFNSQFAEEVLADEFTIDGIPFRQNSELRVPANEIEVYIGSLHSMQGVFHPTPRISLYNAAIDAVVRPEIEQEIAANGYFQDWVQRDIFFCRNSK